VTFFMFTSSAEANTSAGAPWLAWAARLDEESNENFTSVPGYSSSNWASASVKASVSEAAASTTMSPETGVAVVVIVVAAALGAVSSSPQEAPVATSRTASSHAQRPRPAADEGRAVMPAGSQLVSIRR
jgi:hypothetical protein